MDKAEQFKILTKGAATLISDESLIEKLKENRPLRVKLGFDPTAPDIHLGHTVVLRKLKAFQDLGHQVVVIIGDYTAMIGDPSGKSATRPQLSREAVLANAETYKNQIFKVLDREKTEFRFNSEWLAGMSFADILSLMSKQTVARMLERDDFQNRFRSNTPISMHEFLYPLMQAYDSVKINADVELGGTDQTFNVLLGRTIQKEYGIERSQIALLMPILEGIDGVKKMSKSLGNYIGIDEAPEEIFGKVMSLPDNLILRYFELCTDIHPDDLSAMKKQLEEDAVNPMSLKKKLGRTIVALYYDEEAGVRAEEAFVKRFSEKQLPDEIPEFVVTADLISDGKIYLPKILVAAKLTSSAGEARRTIQQNGVKINSETITEFEQPFDSEAIVQVGKRRIVKLIRG